LVQNEHANVLMHKNQENAFLAISFEHAPAAHYGTPPQYAGPARLDDHTGIPQGRFERDYKDP
jgi:hypothetical protein